MKAIVLGVLFLFTVGALAQDEPRFETYLGYSFTRVNSGINVPAFSANGGLGEVAFNETHDSRSFKVPNTTVVIANTTLSQRFVNDATAFSMLVGGGLDLPINTRLAFRPIKLDYYMTRFQPVFIQGLGNANRERNQSNLLYSTGLNFRF